MMREAPAKRRTFGRNFEITGGFQTIFWSGCREVCLPRDARDFTEGSIEWREHCHLIGEARGPECLQSWFLFDDRTSDSNGPCPLNARFAAITGTSSATSMPSHVTRCQRS